MGISPLSIYKKQRYKNIRKTPNLITLFNGKSYFLRLFLRFKTLENGEKMKQKCQNKYPKMQF